MSDSNRKRIDVLCLTYGEPPEQEWYPQYAYSLSILRRLTLRVAPIPRFILPLLAARRGLIRVATFKEKGYHSPLEAISRQQAEGIARQLRALRPDIDWVVKMVCEFRPPYVWEYLEKMRDDPPDELIMLPLYMAESDFTSGVSRTDLQDFHDGCFRAHPLPNPRYVKGFGFDEQIGKAMADYVWNYCVENGWDESRTRDAALILGAHGTLQYPPPNINSGAKETLFLFGLIRKHLKEKFKTVRIGWLNHDLGGKWTFPAADESAEEVWNQGIREVVYFPFGFMGDNAESQIEGRDALANFDWADMLYLPCPNEDEAFLRAISEKVIARLGEPSEPWHSINDGTGWLINREKPPLSGRPGFLKFPGPTLARIATGFWVMVGGLLLLRGAYFAVNIQSGWSALAALCLSVALGLFKGKTVMRKMALKNLVRLRRIPQPSPIWKLFSTATWIIVFFFMGVGIAISQAGLAPEVRSTILLAVGLAMFVGVYYYIANLNEARPITKRPPVKFPPVANLKERD